MNSFPEPPHLARIAITCASGSGKIIVGDGAGIGAPFVEMDAINWQAAAGEAEAAASPR